MIEISREVQEGLAVAQEWAIEKTHEYFTVEHVVLGLLSTETCANILKQMGADAARIRIEIEDFLTQTSPTIEDGELKQTRMVQKLFDFAVQHVPEQLLGDSSPLVSALLLALYYLPDCFAASILQEHGVRRTDLIALTESLGKEPQQDGFALESAGVPAYEQEGGFVGKEVVPYRATSLLDPEMRVGREQELRQCLEVLRRKYRRHIYVASDAGMGKTALVDALYFARKEAGLNSMVHVQLNSLMASAKYRGELEEKFDQIAEEVQRLIEPVVVLENIDRWLGSGAQNQDVQHLVHHLLALNGVSLILVGGFPGFKNLTQGDPVAAQSFERVELSEFQVDELQEVIARQIVLLARFHRLDVDAELGASLAATARKRADSHNPRIAIEKLDNWMAHLRAQDNPVCRGEDFEEYLGKQAVHKQTVRATITSREDAAAFLNAKIFGQDAAIEALSKQYVRARAGLGAPDKPRSAFMFAGPTGVGKTELCKLYAELLAVPLVRFDMSEYMEAHSVSRFLGAPPGYIGFQEGGAFANAIVQHRAAVFLFDEFEKAHQDIQNVLLQALDYGLVTDAQGHELDFRSSHFVFTTNAGAENLSSSRIGFGAGPARGVVLAAIRERFTPEFRNRLSDVIVFESLGPEVVQHIARKELDLVSERLHARGVELRWDETVESWLALRGFDPHMGARPLARLIDELIVTPVAEKLLQHGERTESEREHLILQIALQDSKEALQLVVLEN
jgi:ATP-dependent Clp protease ATP-binding subunit ClpA